MEVFALIILVVVFLAWLITRSKKEKAPDASARTTAATPTEENPEATATGGRELAFVDLETTGLDPSEDRITEVALLIHKDGGSRFDGYSELANPGRSIPGRITELTGITDEMVADKKPTSEIVRKLLDRIGDRTIVAYNAEFDMSFLQAEASRMGRKIENKSYCLMEYVKTNHPNLRRYRLQDVCSDFRITAEEAERNGLSPHRAMYDAERAVRLYIAIHNGEQPDLQAEDDQQFYGRRLDHGQLSRYHGMRSSAKMLSQEAKEAEITDLEKAIHGYKSAIKLHIESAKIQIYIETSARNDKSLHAESGDIECLNRLTMCLCKLGKAEEAKAAMDEYFASFPKDSELKSAEQVRKRIEKSTSRLK
jgi:DNA polymerase III epsilon subunit family exonuclease